MDPHAKSILLTLLCFIAAAIAASCASNAFVVVGCRDNGTICRGEEGDDLLNAGG